MSFSVVLEDQSGADKGFLETISLMLRCELRGSLGWSMHRRIPSLSDGAKG